MDFSDFLDVLELTSLAFADLRRKSLPIPLNSLASLCKYFDLTMNSFIEGDIDYKKLLSNQSDFLREKYSENAFSKCRTVNYLLHFIEKRFGWRKRDHVLKYFQVDEGALADLDRPINLKLSIDIGNYFLKYFNNPEILFGMGQTSFFTNKSASFVEELNNTKSYGQLFDIMCKDVIPNRIEKNYKWEVQSAESQSLLLKGYPDKDIVGLLGEDYVCGTSATLVRKGFFSAIPLYVGKHRAEINRIESYRDNKSFDVFQLNFSEAF